MFPLEVDGKTRWPADRAQYVFQGMRRDVIAELRARDISHGIPADGKVYRMEKIASGPNGQMEEKFVIDHALAQVKHSGAETNSILQHRWDEFCSQPRDSTEVEFERPKRVTKFDRLQGSAIPAEPNGSLSLEDAPKRRGPGRPRKTFDPA